MSKVNWGTDVVGAGDVLGVQQQMARNGAIHRRELDHAAFRKLLFARHYGETLAGNRSSLVLAGLGKLVLGIVIRQSIAALLAGEPRTANGDLRIRELQQTGSGNSSC